MVTLAIVLLFAPTLLEAADKGERSAEMTDRAVTSAVEEGLLFDSGVRANSITAVTTDGVVTLQGTVDNILSRDRAAKIAGQIRGVRAVVNRIEVSPENRPDADLQQDVRNALLLDPAADSYEITANAKDGVVTLSGTVDSWQEKQLAIHVAKGVRGVRDVEDRMRVDYQTARLDAEIKAEVERALAIDVWVDAPRVKVDVAEGAVGLSGVVGSVAEKQRAYADAWVAGVKSVEIEGLQVDPSTQPSDLRTKDAARADDEIAAAVNDAFLYDPRVMSFRPEVSVSHGVVTLTGSVDNVRARQAAERDARNTTGVRRVVNHLKVRPVKELTDEAVARSLRAALIRNTITDAYELSVSVKDGVASLSGTVDSFLEKSEAESVAQRTNGVTDIQNNIDVRFPAFTYFNYGYDPYWTYDPYYNPSDAYAMNRPPAHSTWPYTSDTEVKDDIEDELFWSPFVDSDQVTVGVSNGVATLTGRVEDWSEFRAATENAYEGGARHVINNLRIQ